MKAKLVLALFLGNLSAHKLHHKNV